MADQPPFIIKKGDTRPKYRATLYQDFGTVDQAVIDLTSATSIKFIMKKVGVAPKVNAAAAFINKPSGVVEYTWAVGDTDTVDDYDAEWQITWNDGGIQTVPNGVVVGNDAVPSYGAISVVADLGD